MTFVHVHIETSALPHRHRCNVAIERMQCDSPAVSAKRGEGWKKAQPGLHAKSWYGHPNVWGWPSQCAMKRLSRTWG